MTDFLLEIGFENLPASYVPPAARQLETDAAGMLEEARLPFDTIYTAGTPRRLVLHVRGLAAGQETRIETVTGPPVSRSFDEDGSPTRAALGFAKSQGLNLDRLETVQTPRGEYLGYQKKLKGRKTTVLLRSRVPELIGGLRFPKTMRWISGGAKFARPIRWIICLYGDKIIRFEFAGVKSGNTSYGIPWIKPAGIPVRRADAYSAAMKKAGIIVDPASRQAQIEKMAAGAAERLGLSLVDDPGLFREITFMVEDPRVFVGDFPKSTCPCPPRS